MIIVISHSGVIKIIAYNLLRWQMLVEPLVFALELSGLLLQLACQVQYVPNGLTVRGVFCLCMCLCSRSNGSGPIVCPGSLMEVQLWGWGIYILKDSGCGWRILNLMALTHSHSQKTTSFSLDGSTRFDSATWSFFKRSCRVNCGYSFE